MDIVEQKGYRIIQPLASGGEGQVFVCEKDSHRFILKVMPCIDLRQREILSQIDTLASGFFPRVHEIFSDEKHAYLIREYIEGNTLREELQKSGSLSYSHAMRIYNKLCEALNLLHHASPQPIVLRDLKPENIILTPDGGVVIIDFGIARHYSPLASRDTIPAGTKGYTAPEAITGFQSDPRSDVYSLSIVLYEMLSGRSLSEPPFQLRPLSECGVFAPASLDRIMAKAADPKPICRYASVSAFQEAIKRIRPRNSVLQTVLSSILCFLLGILLTFGLTSSSIGELFDHSRSAAAKQSDHKSVVGLSMEEAEGLLSTQKLPVTVYGVVTETARINEVVSLSSSSNEIILEVCIGKATDIVSFSDPNLEMSIRDALDIPTGQVIIVSDLSDLTVLDISQQGISSLEGLQYAVNLTQLTANSNVITELSPIAYLGHLRTLYLNDNHISDLTALTYLKNLKTLYLENNRIVELSALKGIDLYDLSLGAHDRADLSPLSSAIHMQRLNLFGNRISDLSALSSMQSLSWLALNENQITDLSPLSKIAALRTLLLSHNAIYDVSPITSNAELVWLDLSSNYITDISSLSRVAKLDTLDLSANTRLADVSPLAKLPNLQALGLAYLESCDYTPLLSLPALSSITFGSPQSIQSDRTLAWVIEQLQQNNIQVLYQ